MTEFLPLGEQSCTNCRFRRGSMCHRHPPSGALPFVGPQQWCGEWAALPDHDSALLQQAEEELEIFGLHEHLGDFKLAAVREVLKRYGTQY